mmetsp:Transcript_14120/g.38030  ORF Transcript_14120/g.38030 Transcript_14120/m.38030 type:complete len:263 (+) Transcript_14120:362-1150(+)
MPSLGARSHTRMDPSRAADTSSASSRAAKSTTGPPCGGDNSSSARALSSHAAGSSSPPAGPAPRAVARRKRRRTVPSMPPVITASWAMETARVRSPRWGDHTDTGVPVVESKSAASPLAMPHATRPRVSSTAAQSTGSSTQMDSACSKPGCGGRVASSSSASPPWSFAAAAAGELSPPSLSPRLLLTSQRPREPSREATHTLPVLVTRTALTTPPALRVPHSRSSRSCPLPSPSSHTRATPSRPPETISPPLRSSAVMPPPS